MGRASDAEITIDWGANAAVLFGRQQAKTHHQTTGSYHYLSGTGKYQHRVTAALSPNAGHRTQSRSLIVPNLGGFAGLSFRYSDAKISVGYRADMFFNAMDVGLDTRKSENVGFYGPFATIGVGLGG
jgi:hypothetical protein